MSTTGKKETILHLFVSLEVIFCSACVPDKDISCDPIQMRHLKILNHLRHLDFELHLFGHYQNNKVALPHIFNDYLHTLTKRKFLARKKSKFYLKVISFFFISFWNNFENSQIISRNAGFVILDLPMICHCKRQMLAKKKNYTMFVGNVSEMFYVQSFTRNTT